MAELRFGLIGCGAMGRHEAKTLAQIPEARLVAVCDVRADSATAFGLEMDVPAFANPATVLANPDVDAVIVATPNFTHPQIVIDAAAAGKHIFCEKPMAFTVQDCDRMIAAAEQAGVRLMVGQVLRLLALFSRIIDLVDQGAIGTPCSAQITRLGWFNDSAVQYRLRKEMTGGLLYEVTVHEIDLLQRIFGPTSSVYATMDRFVVQNADYEDTVHLALRFRAGASAQIFASNASAIGVSTGHIIGERGTLQYDHRAGRISYRLLGNDSDLVSETVTHVDGESGYLRELRSFTEWVLHERPPLLTAQEGRAAIAVAEAAYQSAKSGQPVFVSTS